jgi:hypothetical protein
MEIKSVLIYQNSGMKNNLDFLRDIDNLIILEAKK